MGLPVKTVYNDDYDNGDEVGIDHSNNDIISNGKPVDDDNVIVTINYHHH